MPSSLKSTANQSTIHRRNQPTTDGWAGEETNVLTTIQTLDTHVEWAEGVTPRWDFWVFEENSDIQIGDILICESLDLGVTVTRVSTWPDLKGRFHHYEVNSEEHEWSVAELLA